MGEALDALTADWENEVRETTIVIQWFPYFSVSGGYDLAEHSAEDLRGSRGEAIFTAAIMNFCRKSLPYFDAHFLGEKFPTFDHIVHVVESNPSVTAYFFAQVKTTKGRYETRRNGRKYLKINLSKEQLNSMHQYPGPAYLFGVDETNGAVFVVAITKAFSTGFSGMLAEHVVNCNVLAIIANEVKAFWASSSGKFNSLYTF